MPAEDIRAPNAPRRRQRLPRIGGLVPRGSVYPTCSRRGYRTEDESGASQTTQLQVSLYSKNNKKEIITYGTHMLQTALQNLGAKRPFKHRGRPTVVDSVSVPRPTVKGREQMGPSRTLTQPTRLRLFLVSIVPDKSEGLLSLRPSGLSVSHPSAACLMRGLPHAQWRQSDRRGLGRRRWNHQEYRHQVRRDGCRSMKGAGAVRDGEQHG